MENDTIIIGAGVIGASIAYHLKKNNPDRNILLIDRENRVGAGNTAKSAALYRNIFSSFTSKLLSTSSIRYYLELGDAIRMDPTGYLWMFSSDQWTRSAGAISTLNPEKDDIHIMDQESIGRELNINLSGKGPFPSIERGIRGGLCGSLSGMGLAQDYAGKFEELGGHILLSTSIDDLELTGASSRFAPWDDIRVRSIRDRDGNELRADSFIFATGAWTQEILGRYGVFTGTLPKKRQLFGIRVDDPYQVAGDIDLEKVPAMILPAGGTYVKPILHRKLMIIGLADDLGQPYNMKDPDHDEEYFHKAISPVLEHYFPDLDGWEMKMKWAGYYSYHLPDKNPIVESIKNITWVAGTSGSGIMKADAIGRITASRMMGNDITDLYDGSRIKTNSISLKERNVDIERFVI